MNNSVISIEYSCIYLTYSAKLWKLVGDRWDIIWLFLVICWTCFGHFLVTVGSLRGDLGELRE